MMIVPVFLIIVFRLHIKTVLDIVIEAESTVRWRASMNGHVLSL